MHTKRISTQSAKQHDCNLDSGQWALLKVMLYSYTRFLFQTRHPCAVSCLSALCFVAALFLTLYIPQASILAELHYLLEEGRPGCGWRPRGSPQQPLSRVALLLLPRRESP